MRALYCLIVLSILAATLVCATAVSAGSGVKVFAPSELSVSPDRLPVSYNGSFIVQNDGLLEGVYIVRVAVDDPAAISWITVTPSGFVLAPGELRQVNFSIFVEEGQAVPGTYNIVFMPTLLPLNVEPYLDTFANYVSLVDHYNFTVQIPESPGSMALGLEPGKTPVTFSDDGERVNLVQYVRPESGNRVVTEIDRAIRVNVPSGAQVGQPVPVSISVFEGLSSSGINLMAISPKGIFYPITGENFTFDRAGRWGVIAMVGDVVLLGKPVDVSEGGLRLAMPGIGTILAAIALLLLLSLVPIWLMGRGAERADPYDEITYKACVIRKYIDKFDPLRLRRAVSQLKEEYDSLVVRHIRGNSKEALAELEELETLASLESMSNV